MTWDVAVREAAEQDAKRALGWYESEAPEQVVRFSREFDTTIARIAAHADVPAPFLHEIRRVALRNFPYQLWYVIDPTLRMVQVIAVVHDRQNPASFGARDR